MHRHHPSLTWFEVELFEPEGPNTQAQMLRKVLWPEGHDTWQVCDTEGNWFLAVSICGPAAQQQLERLLQKAGFSYHLAPLDRPIEVRLEA